MRQIIEKQLVEPGALAPLSDALHRTVLRQSPPRLRVAAACGIMVYRSFAESEEVWRAFEAEALGTAFQSYDWLSLWHAHVGVKEGIQPAIVTVTRGGHIVMLAALGLEWHMGLRRIVWLGGRMTDYKAPLLSADIAHYIGPGQFPVLWRQICRALPRHDFVQLEDQPQFVVGAPNPFAELESQPAPDKAYAFHLPPSFEELTHRYRPETRRTDRSKARKLAARGAVVFRIVPPGIEAIQKLDQIIDQKAAQLRAQGIRSIFEDASYRAAFRSLAMMDGERQILQIAEFTLDGVFLSGSISNMRHGHTALLVHTYVSGEHDRLSPGRQHLIEHLKASIDAGMNIYDLSVGYAPYKESFCDTPMQMFTHIEAGRSLALPLVGAMRARIALKRAIKANPLLMNFYRRMRETLAGR